MEYSYSKYIFQNGQNRKERNLLGKEKIALKYEKIEHN
jgi:hypothetical protein